MWAGMVSVLRRREGVEQLSRGDVMGPQRPQARASEVVVGIFSHLSKGEWPQGDAGSSVSDGGKRIGGEPPDVHRLHKGEAYRPHLPLQAKPATSPGPLA